MKDRTVIFAWLMICLSALAIFTFPSYYFEQRKVYHPAIQELIEIPILPLLIEVTSFIIFAVLWILLLYRSVIAWWLLVSLHGVLFISFFSLMFSGDIAAWLILNALFGSPILILLTDRPSGWEKDSSLPKEKFIWKKVERLMDKEKHPLSSEDENIAQKLVNIVDCGP